MFLKPFRNTVFSEGHAPAAVPGADIRLYLVLVAQLSFTTRSRVYHHTALRRLDRLYVELRREELFPGVWYGESE